MRLNMRDMLDMCENTWTQLTQLFGIVSRANCVPFSSGTQLFAVKP